MIDCIYRVHIQTDLGNDRHGDPEWMEFTSQIPESLCVPGIVVAFDKLALPFTGLTWHNQKRCVILVSAQCPPLSKVAGFRELLLASNFQPKDPTKQS